MNQVANVVFAYNAKNDDELELKVGDRIEVIGVEEEGWWRGKLKGRIGVFPTNFVQLVETNPTESLNNNITSTTNKLSNIFGNKANKNSLSNNSLNSNSSYNNNNNNSNINNNNLIMDNTHQIDCSDSLTCGSNDDPSITSSDKRPKPIRGIGYGDIFASAGATKQKPLPAISSSTATSGFVSGNNIPTGADRLNSILSLQQKQIPKKPPPPAPHNVGSDQAPALPPKPTNQFSPLLQQQQISRPLNQPLPQLNQAREQAKVIYAYEPTNDDELAMEVGDIIDIIDKEIEDAGWWKGELRGKIGVFPDNFVQLIDTSNTELSSSTATAPLPPLPSNVQNSDWQNNNTNRSVTSNINNNHQLHSTNIESRINNKSVFATKPKDFSKELENNLEKHQHNINNNLGPGSSLSAKRNKLQQFSSLTASLDSHLMGTSSNENNKDHIESSPEHSSSTTSPNSKLNHITTNRAKGPSRRPPSNVLKQLDQSSVKRDLASNGKDDHPSILASLPINSNSSPIVNNNNKNSERSPSLNNNNNNNNNDPTLSSLPLIRQQLTHSTVTSTSTNFYTQSAKSTNLANDQSPTSSAAPIKSSATTTVENVLENNQSIAPVLSQRSSQPPMVNTVSTPVEKTSNVTNTPSWMVELKKAHAEKKRDVPPTNVTSSSNTTSNSTAFNKKHSSINPTNNTAPQPVAVEVDKPIEPVLEKKIAVGVVKEETVAQPNMVTVVPALSNAQYETIVKQISKKFTEEISELKGEIKILREDFTALGDMKNVLENMKAELRVCQSASENQKRYIKDLINNLADERRKIASMQEEIDRNLK